MLKLVIQPIIMGFKETYSERIAFWFTVGTTPFSLLVTILTALKINTTITLMSALFASVVVIDIVYIINLRGEIKDLKRKINKLRRDKNVYEQKLHTYN